MIDDIQQLLEDAVRETGVELKREAGELAALSGQMAVVLSASVGQPGYDQAAIAARDILVLEAGLDALQQHDEARGRFLGILTSSLQFIVSALVARSGGGIPSIGGQTA